MVFVTGATGLLGSHLLYFLAVSGHSVSALRRKQSRLEDSRAVFLQYPDGERYWNTINWVEGDGVQKEGLAEYVRGVFFGDGSDASDEYQPARD